MFVNLGLSLVGYFPFHILQTLSGVSKSELMSSISDQDILIATFKSSLGSDANLTAHMNVTIASVSDNVTRRLRGNNNQHRIHSLSGVNIKFKIMFDVDRQQYLNVDDGINQITTHCAADASSGNFTKKLHIRANGGALSAAEGGSTSTYTPPETKTIALFHPTMQPTVSSKPSVLPTRMPSTQKPTLQPTTVVPSFAPTYKTGEFILFDYYSVLD